MPKSHFRHDALFYRDDDEFLAGTVPLLRESMEGGEPALVAVRTGKAALLRAELGDEASEVEFLDMEAIGRNPARIIPVWQEFLDGAPDDGPLLGIGEPVWPERSEAELDECRRHEALLNVAFGGGRAWSLICPYDSAALDDEVLASARDTHPAVMRDGARSENAVWSGSEGVFSPFTGDLPDPPGGSQILRFSRERLAEARELVCAAADRARLSRERATDLVAAVSELAANSVRHGGGTGTLCIWRERDALIAEVRDAGRIAGPLVGRERPTLSQEGGRGLWMANQLCDLVQVRSGNEGTGVRLRMGLS